MPPQIDFVRLMFAFGVGTLWIYTATRVSEKKGGIFGGFVAALPSTVVVAFAFIAYDQSVSQAVEVASAFPMAFSITCLFPLFYALFSKRGIAVALLFSLLLWFSLAFLTVVANPRNLAVSVLGSAVVCVSAYTVVTVKHYQPRELTDSTDQRGPTGRAMVARAALGGVVVVSAVAASQLGGAVLGSVFASFPAVFSATLGIESVGRGLERARSMAKPMFLTSSLAIIPYGIAVTSFFPMFGYILGSVACYGVAMIGAGLALFVLRNR